MPLIYDADIVYDTPLYTYDGDLIEQISFTIKDAIYRELKFGTTAELFADVLLDTRLIAGSLPVVTFRRITSSEINEIGYARDRFEIEIVADPADDVETLREAVLDAFAGKFRTLGAYNEQGTPDATVGLRAKALHVGTVEGYDERTRETYSILIFLFSYLRG